MSRYQSYVMPRVIFLVASSILISCDHEDFFTYEPPPSPRFQNRISFDVIEQWEGGQTYSEDKAIGAIAQNEVIFEVPASCPEGAKQVKLERTRFTAAGLYVSLITDKGYPLGIYKEKSAADPCDLEGPFFEISYAPSTLSQEPPFISDKQKGTLEVVHTIHEVPAVTFDIDLFKMEQDSLGGFTSVITGDSIQINVQGRIYTTIPGFGEN
ncbi:MAG: hypothetical protein KTR29_19940 [Rhodothermaceae bacterium]|nr:hypothetical protein [Rhodothermaceae bacterium]